MTTHELKIPYDDELLRALGKAPADAETHLRFVMAAKLFELGELSSGQAAKLCGLSRVAFITRLGEIGVAAIDLDDDEIEDELRVD